MSMLSDLKDIIFLRDVIDAIDALWYVAPITSITTITSTDFFIFSMMPFLNNAVCNPIKIPSFCRSNRDTLRFCFRNQLFMIILRFELVEEDAALVKRFDIRNDGNGIAINETVRCRQDEALQVRVVLLARRAIGKLQIRNARTCSRKRRHQDSILFFRC